MSTTYCVSYGSYYAYLNTGNLPTVDVEIKRFNDMEISVKFRESLRGKHLFVFGEVVNNLNELIMTLDAAKRCSVSEITVVLPYFGYSRQDKREGTRGCIGAKAIAHVIESMGIDRVISIDLHASQIQGYFQVPFEHLSGIKIFEYALKERMADIWDDVLFATPDAGGTLRALKFASACYSKQIVTINKRRDKPGIVSSMELTGDVMDKHIIIVDDIGDTCGTLSKASDLLIANGAVKTYAIVTHPVLTGEAVKTLRNSSISTVLMSDTLDAVSKIKAVQKTERFGETAIQIISCQRLLETAIREIAADRSISHLN